MLGDFFERLLKEENYSILTVFAFSCFFTPLFYVFGGGRGDNQIIIENCTFLERCWFRGIFEVIMIIMLLLGFIYIGIWFSVRKERKEKKNKKFKTISDEINYTKTFVANINIEDCFLGQNISDCTNLTEFSNEEYSYFRAAGAKPISNDERLYSYASTVIYGDVKWDAITVGAMNNIVYKISLQLFNIETGLLSKLVAFLKTQFGNSVQHEEFSNKYIWETDEATIFLNMRSINSMSSINLIFTSKRFSNKEL